MKIGFIGQGWIGKNYANDFEARAFEVIRYALEPKYLHNREAIRGCDIVFIAVPTPTTPSGFDHSIVSEALSLVAPGKTAVIKSTLLPGTTMKLQREYPDIYVLCSPEFLVEKTAAHDAAHPNRNIIGIPIEDHVYRSKAEMVMSVLPQAPYNTIIPSTDAEFVKYAGNCFLFSKVIFMNLLFDVVSRMGGNWDVVREAVIHDPRIGESHTNPVHSSGRGAGGHCFIKDFEAFRRLYMDSVDDPIGSQLLSTMVDKNVALLRESNKDLDLLAGVYGNIQPSSEHKQAHVKLNE